MTRVSLPYQKSLTLEANETYHYDEMSLSYWGDSGFELYLDLTNPGDILVLVDGNIDVSGSTRVFVKGPGMAGFENIATLYQSDELLARELASRVEFELKGTMTLYGGDPQWFGRTYAPSADCIRLYDGFVIGNLWSPVVELNAGSHVVGALNPVPEPSVLALLGLAALALIVRRP